MRFLLLTAVALVGVLAAPISALADGRMCMVVSASEGEPLFLEFGRALETARTVSAGEAPERSEGVVLWCAIADDPRCSPVRHDERPGTEWLRGPLRSGGPEHGDVAAPAANDVQFVNDGTAAARGVRHRVDRPPRA